MDTIALAGTDLDRLAAGAVAVTDQPAVFRIEGPQAVACLQGLLTNDVAAPGDDALVYGAILTPKGMIVSDHWVFRNAGGFLLVGDAAGRDATALGLRRQLPPRLARATDLTGAWTALWVLGEAGADPRLAAALGEAGGVPAGALPAPGRSVLAGEGPEAVRIGRGPAGAPFAWLATGPAAAVTALARALAAAGAGAGAPGLLRAARVRAGAPTLGAEIGDRTLPQEVRFDELGGVSYQKGCYVGQETVARLHFRGRPNWLLRGIEPLAPGAPSAAGDELTLDGRPAGRVTTALAVDGVVRRALASVRREVEPGAVLASPWGPARVAALPFAQLR